MRFRKGALNFLIKESNMTFEEFCQLICKNKKETMAILHGATVVDRDVAEKIIKKFGALKSMVAIDWEGSGLTQPALSTIFKNNEVSYAN